MSAVLSPSVEAKVRRAIKEMLVGFVYAVRIAIRHQ